MKSADGQEGGRHPCIPPQARGHSPLVACQRRLSQCRNPCTPSPRHWAPYRHHRSLLTLCRLLRHAPLSCNATECRDPAGAAPLRLYLANLLDCHKGLLPFGLGDRAATFTFAAVLGRLAVQGRVACMVALALKGIGVTLALPEMHVDPVANAKLAGIRDGTFGLVAAIEVARCNQCAVAHAFGHPGMQLRVGCEALGDAFALSVL
jgi:hypothetical protein